jgi:hypothetical protein
MRYIEVFIIIFVLLILFVNKCNCIEKYTNDSDMALSPSTNCSGLTGVPSYCLDIPNGVPCEKYYVDFENPDPLNHKICQRNPVGGCEPGESKCYKNINYCIENKLTPGYTKWVRRSDPCICPAGSPNIEIDKTDDQKKRCAPEESNCAYIEDIIFKLKGFDQVEYEFVNMNYINPNGLVTAGIKKGMYPAINEFDEHQQFNKGNYYLDVPKINVISPKEENYTLNMMVNINFPENCNLVTINIIDNVNSRPVTRIFNSSGSLRQLKFEAGLTYGNLTAMNSDVPEYVITMTLQIPYKKTKIYTFRPTCVEDKFGYNDFLSCVCPLGKIKTDGGIDNGISKWICNDPLPPSDETCDKAFNHLTDDLYDQFIKCYEFKGSIENLQSYNNDCKFDYGDVRNECLPETKLDCSQMNFEYGHTGFDRLTGWKILSETNQKNICENVYSKRRGLKCKLYTGMDNECGFSDNLVIFNLIVPDKPTPSKSFEYTATDKAVKNKLCGTVCESTIYKSGIYSETMQQLYDTMGIHYIGVQTGKFNFRTSSSWSTFHLVLNKNSPKNIIHKMTLTANSFGDMLTFDGIEEGSFITSIFISGVHLTP